MHIPLKNFPYAVAYAYASLIFFPYAYAYAYASLIFSPYAYAYAYASLIFFPYAYAYHMQAYACDMHMHVICAYAFDNTGSVCD